MKALVDLHTHTLVSGHAYSTLRENIDEANKKGLIVLGTSEHSIAMPGTTHEFYFHNLKVIKDYIDNVRILKGIEANIIDYDGSIDVCDAVIEGLDYMIASLHFVCIKPGSIEENTNALLNVMNIPKVKIIGHPDDEKFKLDYEKFVIKAKEKNVLIELNNSSLNPNSFRQNSKDIDIVILELCKKYNVNIIFGSDAHIYYDVGNFENCEKLVEEINFPKSLIVNYNIDKFKTYFKI